MRTISPGRILRVISPYTQRIVSTLPGQSVELCGQPSQVASCLSHSAGIEKPSAAGVESVKIWSFAIECPRNIETSVGQFNLLPSISSRWDGSDTTIKPEP